MTTNPPTTRRATARRVLVIAVLMVAAGLAHVWYGNRHHFFDLHIYWQAVRSWRGGHDLYEYAYADRVQGALGFTYPPFAALVLSPLAALPFPAAAAVFTAVSVLAAVVAVYLVVAPIGARHGWPAWYPLGLAVPLVSWLEPVRETVTFGQINLLLAALVVADLLVAVPRRSRLAGVGVGLAAAVKLTPAIFIVYLLLCRRWRAAATATATAAAASLLAALLAWPDSWRFWSELLWDTGRVGHLDRIPNQSILAALTRLAAPGEPSRAVWLLLVAVVLTGGLWRARRAGLCGDHLAGMTLAGLTGSLVSPVTWSHHLFWFVPALAVLLDAGTSGPHRGRAGYLALAAAGYLTVTVSVIAWYDWGLPRDRVDHGLPGFLIDNWYVLLMLLLVAVLPVRRRVTEQPPARPVSPAGTPASPGSTGRSAA